MVSVHISAAFMSGIMRHVFLADKSEGSIHCSSLFTQVEHAVGASASWDLRD